MKGNTIVAPVRRVTAGAASAAQDLLAVEEPLEIRILDRSVAVTMRTPGHDVDLAAGFLFTEGILTSADQIERLEPAAESGNVIEVMLRPGCSVDIGRLERHSYISSSCGVCGKTSISALESVCPSLSLGRFGVGADVLRRLPDALQETQPVFARTGGLHAAALFDREGRIRSVREDVGRHNALDKLIGAEFLDSRVPVEDRGLFLSGRVSFELVQKAVMAGIPMIAAIGAPSSLAVQTALRFGMTLVGFVREGRFNLYAGAERIQEEA